MNFNLAKVEVQKIMLILILTATFLPYLKTTPFESDIQPHVMGFFILCIILNALLFNKLSMPISGFIAALFYILLVLALEGSFFDIVRITFTFFSFFLFVGIMPKYPKTVGCFIEGVVLIYFIVAVFQYFCGDKIIMAIISNFRTSEGRGVTSLTSEPSYFGIISFSQIILLEFFGGKRKRVFQFLALINIFISASLAAIAPAILYLIFYFFKASKISILFIFIITILFFIIVLLHYLPDLRIAKLINIILDDPVLLISKDISFVNRITRTFGPIYLAFYDSLSPHYFSVVESDLHRINDIKGVPSEAEITRLSNIVSYFLYGFGFLSLPLFIYYFYISYRYKTPFFLLFAIIYFMLANISIVTPYALLVLSIPFFNKNMTSRRVF